MCFAGSYGETEYLSFHCAIINAVSIIFTYINELGQNRAYMWPYGTITEANQLRKLYIFIDFISLKFYNNE